MDNQNLGKMVQRMQQARERGAMRSSRISQPRRGESVRNRQGDRINLSE